MIVLCAGGTAGHVFPALALAEKLGSKNCKIITDKRGEKYITKEAKLEKTTLPIRALNYKFFLKSFALFFKSISAIKKSKIVVSFGGYTSLFPFLAAKIMRKKFYIYQLDSHVTRLHRFISKYSDKIFCSFPQTNFFKIKNTPIFSGIPLRQNFEFSPIPKFEGKLKISIIGGSLGSNFWEQLISSVLHELKDLSKKISLTIQTKKEPKFLKKFELADLNWAEFYETAQLFKESHLIISRAGASTISEISAIGRPAFLVPWGKSMENHQQKNAENYSKISKCEYGNEKDYLLLANLIRKIFLDPKNLNRLSESAATALPQYASHKAAFEIKYMLEKL